MKRCYSPPAKSRRNPRKKGSRERRGYALQALFFAGAHWSIPRAARWMAENGHKPQWVRHQGRDIVAQLQPASEFLPHTLHEVHVTKNVEGLAGMPHEDAELQRRSYRIARKATRQRDMFSSSPEMPYSGYDPDLGF